MAFLPDLSVITSVYRGESFLAAFLENLRAQTLFPRCEVILILNESSSGENKVAKAFASKYRQQVHIEKVEKVETLGASWNRARRSAQAPYLAIWNIDDRRALDSLDRQLAALEQNLDWTLCYGDYVTVPAHGERGAIRLTPSYNAKHFRRSFAQGGAFWVLRKLVFDHVGPFDEQFQVAADMDLSFRIAEAGMQMGRVDGILGYFLDAGLGLSTSEGAYRSAIERTTVQLRYGVFDKVKPEYLKEASQFRLEAIQVEGKWTDLSEHLPNLEVSLRWRQPLWLLGKLRNGLRSFLDRFGLLRWVYRLQTRFWKDEI